MSIGLLSDAYSRARMLLNDEEGNNWPDYKLTTKAVLAFEELEAELIIAGIPVVHSVSTVITVPAMTTDDSNLDLSTVTGYPIDLLLPMWMKERQLGDTNSDFVDMTEVDFIPNIDIDIYLHYWCWIQNTIMLRGCLNSVQVQLRYKRYLPIPAANTDSLIVPLSQLFIAYRIAALAAQSVNDMTRFQSYTATADKNLSRILDMNILELQDLPAKRIGYHRSINLNRDLGNY